MAMRRTSRGSSRWRVLVRRNQWLLLGLAAVSLLLWGRLRLRGEIPRVAVADDPPTAVSTQPPPPSRPQPSSPPPAMPEAASAESRPVGL